jgi:sirohydrochlorin ferrochelatase
MLRFPPARLAVPLALATLLALAPATALPRGTEPGEFGVLLMAHGGSDEWDASVRAATTALSARMPVEIAFGMADAVSLQSAVARLEARGARRIGVVRLFISGDSWLQRTEQILGLVPGAPPRPADDGDRGHAGHGRHSMEFWRIDTSARFALTTQGLNEAAEVDEILVTRARALSSVPAEEDVLILAHGVGTDEENDRWRALIEARARRMAEEIPFRRVMVDTLAEDWEEPRLEAEARVRAFVARAAANGRAIVIPFRLAGFGPYARVLEGLDYVADGHGLLPHPAVARWIGRQADELRASRFRPQIAVEEITEETH